MAELHMCMSDALDAVCLLRTEQQQAKHMTWGLGSGSGKGQAAVLHRDKTRRENTRKSRTSSKKYGLQDLAARGLRVRREMVLASPRRERD